jgi:hypothetical protein
MVSIRFDTSRSTEMIQCFCAWSVYVFTYRMSEDVPTEIHTTQHWSAWWNSVSETLLNALFKYTLYMLYCMFISLIHIIVFMSKIVYVCSIFAVYIFIVVLASVRIVRI